MTELSIRFRLQDFVKMEMSLQRSVWSLLTTQKCREIEESLSERMAGFKFYFKHSAKETHGILVCEDKSLFKQSTQERVVNEVKLRINERLAQIKMMVLSTNYWSLRSQFEQIKAAVGVRLQIHCNSGNPLKYAHSLNETHWKQKDQELWRSYTSNMNPVKRNQQPSNQRRDIKRSDEIRVLGTNECLLIGLEDQVEKFCQQIDKRLAQLPQRKYPFLKYQSMIAQKVEETRNCSISPLEGGGILVRGRYYLEGFLDYMAQITEMREMPAYWEQGRDNCLIEIEKKTIEFKDLRNTFLAGLNISYTNEYEVLKIERVQNSHLWEQYSREKFLLSCHQFYRELEVYQTEDGLFSLLDFTQLESSESPRRMCDGRVFAENARIYDSKLKEETKVQILFKAVIGEVHTESVKQKGTIVPSSQEKQTMMISTKKGKKYRIFVQSRTYPAYRISYQRI